MVDGKTATLAIGGMALVTYATRAGGLWLMSRISVTPRIAAFLHHLSGSVLVAIVVPATLSGDVATWGAVGATAVAMAATRRLMASMAFGVVVAALVRGLTD